MVHSKLSGAAVFLSLLLFLLSLLPSSHSIPAVRFSLDSASLTASIQVNGPTWLQTGATWFHALNATFASSDRSLALSSIRDHVGRDSVGPFNATTLTWVTHSTPPLTFLTSYRRYPHPLDPSTLQSIVFEQVWVTGATSTAVSGSGASSDAVLSAFPSFVAGLAGPELGALQWANGFNTNEVFKFSGKNSSLPLSKGGASGPLLLYDGEGRTTAVLSTFTSFMSGSVVASKGATGSTVDFGVAGSVQSIPAGYALEVICVFDDAGINEGVLTWGSTLLSRYGKRRLAYLDDFTQQYIGYSTDNGAYYYYHTEEGKNYEDTLLDVNTYALTQGIPYRHMLLDSWFYFKGALNGAKNWTARPDIFPHGLQFLHSKLAYPFTAHNRWWAPETDYARQNGGDYDFVFGNNFGLPTSQRFWNDLFQNGSVWGLRVYEQDWLSAVWETLPQIKADVTLGRQWLIQMGQGAAKAGINIQYCTPYPRHLLQSVEIPSVTQMRASPDNVPGSDANWRIGESDLLLFSLGIGPFKDTFFTTSVQPGNPYNKSEPSPAIQALIATLSTGPVYPGDGVGFTDVALLAKSHRSDGFILKGDRPAFTLDASYVYRAFGNGTGPDARQITDTLTRINGDAYHVVMVAEESHDFVLTLADLHLPAASQYLTFYYHNQSLSLPSLAAFNRDTPLPLRPNIVKDAFTVFYASPVLSNGLAMLGETSKWVPVSHGRVEWMTVEDEGVTLGLVGGPGEAVKWSWAAPQGGGQWMVRETTCAMNEEGRARLTISVEGTNSCALFTVHAE